MSELREKIAAACVGSPIQNVAAALSGLLVLAVQQQFNCTTEEAVGHLQDFMQYLQRQMAANPEAFNPTEKIQ